MSIDVFKLANTYQRQGILLDTNLLLILFLGLVDKKLLQTHKKSQDYSIDDFEFISKYIDKFHKRWTTPHILTEVSNLASLTKSKHRYLFAKVSQVIANHYFEDYIPYQELTGTAEFVDFGLTDSCILTLAKTKNILIATNDLPLANAISALGKDCLYYDLFRKTNNLNF